MGSRVGPLVSAALAALVAACAALPPAGGPGKGGASPKAGRSAAPTKPGSPAPSASAPVLAASAPADASATPPAGLAGKLARPAAATFPLTGKVKIDAAYAVGRGGTLISDRGGALVANNGGSVVALGARIEGGRLVSNNGGGMIADGAGNMVAPGLEGVALDIGGGLLGNNGGGLISDAGGNLVSKTKLRLLQAAAGPAAPVVGTEAAAAGMLVSVVSLRDRRYLPLGQDEQGRPVYAVYSNAEGAYEVYVPAAETGNLLVVVGPPGEPDRRLAYNLVAPVAKAADAQVDELSGLSSRYLRTCFTGRLADLVVMPAFAQEMLEGDPTTTPEAKKVFAEAFSVLAGAAERAGIDASTDPAEVRAKAQRVVDAGLADLDLEAIMIDAALVADWKAPPKPAMAAMRTRLGELMAGTSKRLQADPAYFSMDFLENTINAPFQPGWTQVPLQGTYQVLKPADFGEFMLVEYFGNIRIGAITSVQRAFRTAFGSAAPRDPDPDAALEARVQEANTEFRGAVGAVMIAMCRGIVADPELVKKAEEIFKAPATP